MTKRKQRNAARPTLRMIALVLLLAEAVFAFDQQAGHAQPPPTVTPGPDNDRARSTWANETGPDYVVLYAPLYDLGGQGAGYFDLTPGNTTGGLRGDDVDIKSRPHGVYAVGWMEIGEWLNYTVEAPLTGVYSITVRAATIEPNARLGIEVDGQPFAAISVTPTGSLELYQDTSAPGGLIAGGVHTIRLVVEQHYLDVEWVRFDLEGEGTLERAPLGMALSSPSADFPNPAGPDSVHIEAENYDQGGQGVAYFDTTPGNNGGAYRQEDVDVKDIGGDNYALGWMATGEWLHYTVDIPRSGYYTVTARAATIEPAALMRVDVDRRPYAYVPILPTGSYDTLQDFSAPAGYLEAGPHVVRVHVVREYFDLDSLRFDLAASAQAAVTPPPLAAPMPPLDTPVGVRDDTYGPLGQPAFTCPSDAIRTTPGDTLQDIVKEAPPRATFCLSAGTYQNQSITPRSGDTFIGEPGAIMDGGKATRFAFVGIFSPNSPDNVREVTIRGLTIQNYASFNAVRSRVNPDAAIEGGEGWIIDGNVLRDNIAGLSLGRGNWGWGDGAAVRHNLILDNAEVGVEINGAGILFENNELAGNGWSLSDADRAWSGGGGKFTDQPVFADDTYERMVNRERDGGAALVIRNNHVHHNDGTGLWLDVDNQHAVVERNLVEENGGSGIVDELGRGTRIRQNVVRYNQASSQSAGPWGGAQILLINAQEGEVSGNEVAVSGQGRVLLMIYEAARTDYPSREYRVTGNVFRFETSPEYAPDGQIVGGVIGGTGDAPFYESDNQFDGNQYYVAGSGLLHWYWGSPMTWAQFQAAGHEATGACYAGDADGPC